MLRYFCACFAFLLLARCSSDQEQQALEQRIRGVEKGLLVSPAADSVVTAEGADLRDRMTHYKVPAVSIAVVSHNGLEWARGYGVLRAGTDYPVTPQSKFHVASPSHMLVAVIALRLVEQGLLKLDEDVNSYLKSWKIRENDFTRERDVTLRLLLTHCAGFNSPESTFVRMAAATRLQILKGERPAENPPAVIVEKPGSRRRYSSFHCLVVQQILEDRLGMPFPRIAEEFLFEPLGMESSSFSATPGRDLGEQLAWSHDAGGNPMPGPASPAEGALPCLVTTPSDLAVLAGDLMRAYLGEADRILSRETVQAMFRREVEPDAGLLGSRTADGLGVLVAGRGRTFSFFHSGLDQAGSTCWLVGFPELGKGGVVMTNAVNGDRLTTEILRAMAREYDWPLPRHTTM